MNRHPLHPLPLTALLLGGLISATAPVWAASPADKAHASAKVEAAAHGKDDNAKGSSAEKAPEASSGTEPERSKATWRPCGEKTGAALAVPREK